MEIQLLIWALLAMSMAAALVSGVFLTFSDFVMSSLRDTAPAGGTEAMQIINRKVYRSIFMVLLIGMAPLSILAGAYGLWSLSSPAAPWLVIAAMAYLLGVMMVTARGNVPMNERLDAMPQAGADAQAYWPTYVTGWVRLNHIRWVSALIAALSYAIAAVHIAASL